MLRASLKSLFCLFAVILIFSCKKGEGQITPTPPAQAPPEAPRFNINAGLVTPGATKEATALYQFLKDNYGKKILSGVMTLNSFDETNWLKANTGKEPAIMGLDFMQPWLLLVRQRPAH